MTSRKKKAKAETKKPTKTKKTSVSKTAKSRAKVSPIPEDYATVTATLILNDAAKTVEFCKAAFGAKLMFMVEGYKNQIAHAVVKIGDSFVHISEAMQAFTSTSSLRLYVKNVDKVMEQAIAAGAEIVTPVADMFWGDRYGVVKDSQGNQWEIATRIEKVSIAELKKRNKDRMMSILVARSGQRGG